MGCAAGPRTLPRRQRQRQPQRQGGSCHALQCRPLPPLPASAWTQGSPPAAAAASEFAPGAGGAAQAHFHRSCQLPCACCWQGEGGAATHRRCSRRLCWRRRCRCHARQSLAVGCTLPPSLLRPALGLQVPASKSGLLRRLLKPPCLSLCHPPGVAELRLGVSGPSVSATEKYLGATQRSSTTVRRPQRSPMPSVMQCTMFSCAIQGLPALWAAVPSCLAGADGPKKRWNGQHGRKRTNGQ